MSIELFKILDDEARVRQDTALTEEMEVLTRIYEGELPQEYHKYFPKNAPKMLVNLIRLAWDDLATQVGRLPELRADALNNSDTEEKRVALLERIGHTYLRAGEPTGKIFMRLLAWWLIGTGRSVVVVRPDLERKLPIMSIRDPRDALPGPKRTAGNMIVELEDLMFKYKLPVSEMKARGLMPLPASNGRDHGPHDKGEIIEYIDDTKWMIVSEGGSVQMSAHNLGMVPGWVFQQFTPNKDALSQFQDQIEFQVMISRMLTQKAAFADRLAYPLLWTRGYEGTIEVGPNVITKLGPQGEMGALDPPTQIQVDRDIDLLQRLSRVLNRNPEARQGEVQAKGTYMSAKTLEQLAEAIDTVVGGYWDTVSVGLQHVLKVCYAMDEKFWPDERKSLTGTMRGRKILDSYMPSKDIAGRYYINCEYGFGMGGYQGFLMQVQMQAARLQSRRGALEQMPGISDVDDKLREIELEGIDDAAAANFQAMAGQGQLDMVLLAKLRKKMAEDGLPLFEVVLEYENELRAQAQQAMTQGGAEAMTTPPEEMAMAEEPLPGIPPAPMIGF